MHRTSSSGVISATMRQTGFRRIFPHKSHTAFKTPATARCVTDFSGPIHRYCESLTMCRQVRPMSAVRSCIVRPTTRLAKMLSVKQMISLPRPLLNAYIIK